jgi:hypothetical protein
MPKNLKRFLSIAAGGVLGATLYGIGQYLITGYTDIAHLIRFTVTWLTGGSIGFLIGIKMLDL